MDDTFEIDSPEELIHLSQNFSQNTGVTGVSGAWREQNFQLMQSVDLGGCNVTPIGEYSSARFVGEFDGNGYSINGLVSKGTGDRGLFGAIFGARIADLVLVDVDIQSDDSGAGGLVGWAHSSIITKIKTSGTVRSDVTSPQVYGAGGIAGGCGIKHHNQL